MYEIVKGMKYLECCMHETLRKYPPLPILQRECSEDYKIPDSDFIIRKGTPVIIPIFGLQRDPDIYENPLEFRPERFLNNASGSDMDGSYYLPFGEGNQINSSAYNFLFNSSIHFTGIRICIGHRMGKQNTCFQLALLLSKYNFELASDDAQEITFNPNQLFLQPIGNVHLKTSLRKKMN
jgi:cytochrome P450 family 6